MSSRPRDAFFLGLLLIAAVCVRLGFWQLGKWRQQRAANRLVEAHMNLPGADLNQPGAPAESLLWRQGSAAGYWDPARTVVLRQRFYDQGPGVELVTPLRLAGSDTAVLVNRGFVPSPDAMTVDLARLPVDSGLVRVAGLVQPFRPGPGGGKPLATEGGTTWQRLDLPALRRALPYPIRDVWLLRSPDQAGPEVPIALRPPPLSDGPYMSYTIQWFAFATIAVVGGGILFVRSRPHPLAPSPQNGEGERK